MEINQTNITTIVNNISSKNDCGTYFHQTKYNPNRYPKGFYSRPIVINKTPKKRGIITKIIKYTNQPIKTLFDSQKTNIYQQYPVVLKDPTFHQNTTPNHYDNNRYEVSRREKAFDNMRIDKSADFAFVKTPTKSRHEHRNYNLKISYNSFGLLKSSLNSCRDGKDNKMYYNSYESLLSPTTDNPRTNHSAEPVPPKIGTYSKRLQLPYRKTSFKIEQHNSTLKDSDLDYVNIHSKRKLNIKDLNTFNNDNNNNNINNINISLDFKKPQSKYPLTNIFESQDIMNTNYDDNSFQTKHMITPSENKHKPSSKDNNKNKTKSYTIRTNIISSNYVHNAYIKSKQLLKNSKSLNTHYNKYLTSTDNNNNNDDNDNDDQLISFTPTPHQKKPKPLILWNNLSKFILNQSSVGPNSLKKITLDQISSKAKKLSSVKRIKLKKQQHHHTEQQQYKQHSNINNIKTTQCTVVHNTLTDNNNNINSSAISLFTKSNMSYIKDTSINNQSHKTSISPIYKAHYNQPQTTMFIRANLGGNKGDLCLKHSTIVNNLFKNK